MFPMSEKSYSIDDIIKEIQENKLNDEDLARYAKDYQKYDTTALLDDVLGRKSDDLLAGIPVSDWLLKFATTLRSVMQIPGR